MQMHQIWGLWLKGEILGQSLVSVTLEFISSEPQFQLRSGKLGIQVKKVNVYQVLKLAAGLKKVIHFLFNQ